MWRKRVKCIAFLMRSLYNIRLKFKRKLIIFIYVFFSKYIKTNVVSYTSFVSIAYYVCTCTFIIPNKAIIMHWMDVDGKMWNWQWLVGFGLKLSEMLWSVCWDLGVLHLFVYCRMIVITNLGDTLSRRFNLSTKTHIWKKKVLGRVGVFHMHNYNITKPSPYS